MRIAPQHAQLDVDIHAPTRAQAWVQQAQWLLDKDSVVQELEVIDARTVRMYVQDPFVTDPHDRDEADRLAADSAMTVLEQTLHGVQLLPTTRTGYVGKLRELSPAQLTFVTGLSHVQRYDLVPDDLDGDGFFAPHEVAHRIEVDSSEDVEQLDWLLRDRFDEGSVQDGLVRIIVPTRPWRIVADS